MAKSTVLKFEQPATLSPRDMFEVHERYFRNGKRLLNSTAWRGKEPRSCGVTRVSARPHTPGEPTTIDVEVTYRPKGYISWLGQTRYDGWDLAPLDQKADGTLLDGNGQPLKDGDPPVYLSYEVYEDTDFNAIEFGNFISEGDMDAMPRTTAEEVFAEVMKAGKFSISMESTFTAPRRSRPNKKIILSNAPTGEGVARFGTLIQNINLSTPNLEQVLMDEMSKLMYDYIEGRISLKTVSSDTTAFVQLSDALVDCEPNELGMDSWFDVLQMYTPIGFLEELGKRLQSMYAVDVSIVEGKEGGIVLRHSKK